jgi:aspartyl-tRNA(Asn)/glutamyl-tRNA(Gln) amidotransferase subunit C
MEIDPETVLKIARLARIRISKNESTEIQNDLNRIVEFVNKLGEIKTDGVNEFNFGQTYLKDMRVDHVTVDNSTTEILKNTNNKNQDFFTVPKIVE